MHASRTCTDIRIRKSGSSCRVCIQHTHSPKHSMLVQAKETLVTTEELTVSVPGDDEQARALLSAIATSDEQEAVISRKRERSHSESEFSRAHSEAQGSRYEEDAVSKSLIGRRNIRASFAFVNSLCRN